MQDNADREAVRRAAGNGFANLRVSGSLKRPDELQAGLGFERCPNLQPHFAFGPDDHHAGGL